MRRSCEIALLISLLTALSESSDAGNSVRKRLLQNQCAMESEDSDGFADFAAKIAGGEEADEGRYPYMTSIQTFVTHTHICGGMLIAEDLVLTAAHCVHPNVAGSEKLPFLLIGAHNLKVPKQAEAREACRTIVHNKFNPARLDKGYDIALIELDAKSTRLPIKLNLIKKRGPFREVRALGWGRDKKKAIPFILQQVDLKIVPNKICLKRMERFLDKVVDSLMCAQKEGKDVCKGDSGGPLLKIGEGCGENDELEGLVSFGFLCTDPKRGVKYPGLFTRVSSYAEWIQKRGEGESDVFSSQLCKKRKAEESGEVAEKPEEESGKEFPDVRPVDSTIPKPAKDSGGCVFVVGVDFNGGVKPMNVGNDDAMDSPQECCDLCKATPGCVVWTYFRIRAKYHPKGACFLRSVYAPATRCSMCTSGLVKEDNLNEPEDKCAYFLGMEFRGGHLLDGFIADRVQKCCVACKKMKKCKSYVYKKGKCFLRSSIKKLSVCGTCQAGVVKARVTSDDNVGVLVEMVPSFSERLQNLNLTTFKSLCRMTVGVDLKSTGLGLNNGKEDIVDSPEACCYMCRNMQGCRSWTFIRVPTLYNPRGACWLKSDIPEEVPCAACTSGVVEGKGVSELDMSSCGVLEGADLTGSDIEGYDVRLTESPKECCTLCEETKKCKSWTRTKNDGKCFLKFKAAPAPMMCSFCDSGVVLSKVTKREIRRLKPVITKK